MKADLDQATLIASELHKNGVSLKKSMRIGIILAETYMLVKIPKVNNEIKLLDWVLEGLEAGTVDFNKRYTASEILELIGILPTRSMATKLSMYLDSVFEIKRTRGSKGERLITILRKR